MDSTHSNLCCLFYFSAKVYQDEPRHGFPLSLDIVMTIQMAMLQGGVLVAAPNLEVVGLVQAKVEIEGAKVDLDDIMEG